MFENDVKNMVFKFPVIKTYEEFNQRRCSTELATVEERDKLANEEMRQVYLWWDEEENKVICLII